MTKSIQTYQDLLDEKERLESLLKVHKATLKQDIEEIKNDLAPLRSAISFASKFLTKKDSNFFVEAGISTLVNVGIKKLLLARAGWVARLLVPYLMKNFSPHVVVENKNKLLKKLFSWIGKKNANGREKHPEHIRTQRPDYN